MASCLLSFPSFPSFPCVPQAQRQARAVPGRAGGVLAEPTGARGRREVPVG